MVTLYSSPDIADINYVQYLLEDAGIPYFLMDYETSGVLPHITGAMGGIKIRVEENDYEKSRKLVDENLHKHLGAKQSGEGGLEPGEIPEKMVVPRPGFGSPIWLFIMLALAIAGTGVFYYFL
jgi:hypothetical protein